jgi:molybdopterin molybdotransferase
VISTAEALDRLFLLARSLGTEEVPLAEAAGRVLAADVVAQRAQPPFAASAMDGYAVRAADIAEGAAFRVIGEAPAGRAHPGTVGPGEAVRIFTGAPVPAGADFVVIQEDTEPTPTGMRLAAVPSGNANIRPAGGDFAPGDRIAAPRLLRPADIALAAAMNAPTVTVRRRPEVAVIATGDELVQPGEEPGPDQIVASNALGLKALFEQAGATARLLPIARDTESSLEAAFRLARGADLIVTIGGASVGDHDLVAPVAARLGMERAFYKVAMRPGKPLMAGRLGEAAVVGLPGNPVSAMVCGHIFVLPLLRTMLGFPPAPAPRLAARLACGIDANGPREHYMRARCARGAVTPFDRQDSSLLSILSGADALLVRPPHDPARQAGAEVEIVPLHGVDEGGAPGP